MSRNSALTIGFVLIFLGLQFFFVKSYQLSPKTTRFIAEHFGERANAQSANNSGGPFGFFSNSNNSPTSFASAMASPVSAYGQKTVVPPKWICWPCFFIGAVFFFHGIAMKRSE